MQKHSVRVKTDQKELQTVTLELGTSTLCIPIYPAHLICAEQTDKDIESANETIKEAEKALAKLRSDVERLLEELSKREV